MSESTGGPPGGVPPWRAPVGNRWTAPALTLLLSCLAAAQALRIWRWRPGTPLSLTGDATQVAMEVRDTIDHGWYWANPDLGYPFHQAGSLFPDPSVLSTLGIKAVALFSGNAFTVAAIWFFIGFPLAGLAMYALMRTQRLARGASVVGGVLFAVAPGHQVMYRHLWLSTYWVVPIGFWVVLSVARGDALFARRQGVEARVRGWLSRRTLTTLGLLTVLGCGHIYYVGFTLLLMAFVVLVRRTGRLTGVVAAGWFGAIALFPLLLGKLATRSLVVTGELPATRTFAQSETYAGKIMDLVMPWYGHRFPPFAQLTFAYDVNARATVEMPAIGLIALCAVVGLLVVALRALFDAGRPRNPDLLRLSGLALVCIGFFTVGGLGSFVAVFITPQLRTWSRMWLFIFTIAILAVGVWLTRIRRRRGIAPAALMAALLLVVGVLDQTSPGSAPAYSANRAELAMLTTYTSRLEAATQPGCPVFQLPVLAYPEATPRGDMEGYDQQLPYLSSHGLRWSGGAIHGTAEADWQLAVDSREPAALAADLRAVGFCAVEVDRAGYDDKVRAPDLAGVLGPPVATSGDGRRLAYDLRSAKASDGAPDDAARRTAVLTPVIVTLHAYGVDVVDGVPSQWAGKLPALSIANLGSRDRPGIRVSMDVTSAGPVGRELDIRNGGRLVQHVALPARQTTRVVVDVDAQPGVLTLGMALSGPPDGTPVPGTSVWASISALTATAADPSVRITTNQAVASR